MITFDNFEKELDLIKESFIKENDDTLFKIDDASSTIATLRIYFFWLFSIICFPLLFNTLGIIGFIIGFIFMGVASYKFQFMRFFHHCFITYKFQFIIHEACHRNLFSKEILNEFIGNLSASLFGMSLKSYRDTHFLHHKYSNTLDDPQFNDALGDRNSDLNKIHFIKFIISPFYFAKFFLFIKREILLNVNNIFQKKRNQKKSINLKFIILSLLINLLIFSFIYFFTNKKILLAFSYHLSLATITLFLARIRTLAEHQYFLQAETPKKFVVSHNTNLFEKMFFYDLNFNYHLEHHIFPRLPYKNLKLFSDKYVKSLHKNYGTLSNSMLSTLIKRFQKAE